MENAELYEYWQRGEYHPYSTEELIDLIADIKPSIPEYCRVNRVVRDIPSTNVVEGNKRTSLRQDIHAEMRQRGTRCRCVRCREVRDENVDWGTLEFDSFSYEAGGAEEHFLSFNTSDDRLAAFLRLSLPGPDSPATGLSDLQSAAIVREVHVYGQSLEVGAGQDGAAQHIGLGTRLMQEAEEIAKRAGLPKIAVISALGTRAYYRKLDYYLGKSYMVKQLHASPVPTR